MNTAGFNIKSDTKIVLNKKNLIKKPAKGGTPAKEKNTKPKKIAKTLL